MGTGLNSSYEPIGPRRRLRGHRLRRYGITLAVAGTFLIAWTFANEPKPPAANAELVASVDGTHEATAGAIDTRQTLAISNSAAGRQFLQLQSSHHLVRGLAVALTVLGLLAHSIGIYRADRALNRRQRQQCDACGHDLRSSMGATHCPECGDDVRCLPSIRVR